MELSEPRHGTELIKRGFASMQKGSVIMDVVNDEQARIAEEAGAVAVMSLERVPSDIRKAGGVARMADPEKVIEIIEAVSIPVMGKVRISHFVDAQVLEVLGVDIIDESEVLSPTAEEYHIEKTRFTVPGYLGALRTFIKKPIREWMGLHSVMHPDTLVNIPPEPVRSSISAWLIGSLSGNDRTDYFFYQCSIFTIVNVVLLSHNCDNNRVVM